MTDKLILEPLNGPFFLLAAPILLIFLVFHIAAQKKDIVWRKRVLSILMILTSVAFIVYKIFLGMDSDYSRICAEAGIGEFNWWGELPLQLCNINMLMIPVALACGNRKLLGFSAYSGTLGALMALLMPSAGFEHYSLLLPRIMGFYGTHMMIFLGSVSLLTLGIYKPRYRDIPLLLVTFYAICAIIFGINMLLRVTGLHTYANYWFNVATEGNPLLELFYSFIPVPLLYTAPALLILLAYMLIITTVYQLVTRSRAAE